MFYFQTIRSTALTTAYAPSRWESPPGSSSCRAPECPRPKGLSWHCILQEYCR